MAIDPGHFSHKSAADLFAKLQRDFDRLCRSPTDADASFNFFVTAEHLPEWHFKGDSKAAAELRKQHALLRLCSHLANGAKHFEVTRHNAVASTATVNVQRLAAGPAGTVESKATVLQFAVNPEPTEAAELGPSITVTELASRIGQFWAGTLGLPWR
jgi:hypothetical protein